MNLKSLLCSPLIHSYLLLFSLLTTSNSSSPDPKFEACKPKTCGNSNITISYPFYIEGKQDSFCGYPGFGLSCDKNNGLPILSLSNTQHIIHEIFYENQSLRVSDAAFSISVNTNMGNCLSRTQNLTLSGNKFQVVPNQKDLFLIFDCDLESMPRWMQEKIIGCSAENKTTSVVALHRDDQYLSFAMQKCKGGVVDSVVEDDVKEGTQLEVLRKGFLLNWTASDCRLCRNSGGRCGFDADSYTFRCYCTDRVHFSHCHPHPQSDPAVVKKRSSWFRKKGFALVLAFTVTLVLVMIGLYYKRWKKKNPTHLMIEALLERHGPLQIRRYVHSEIKKMTNSFRNKLGQGGFGSVYKGKLLDGRHVAVKVLGELKGNGEEFINEVASMSRTSHVNIVSLPGFCFEGSKRALVYEFMPNGSLEKFIFEESTLMVDHELDCQTLYNIAVGVARGLEYLHKGCNTRILHFDIKPHNILLDEDFCPKISDFGLAKISERKESIVSLFGARGTAGYIAPEVFSRNFGAVSHKSDVYSYGMMVLEMVGRRKNIKVEVSRPSEIFFPHWIYDRLVSNQELALQNIRNGSDEDKVRKMTIVSLWCIQTDPSTRPAISKVVEMLEGRVEMLQMPPKPFLSSPSTSMFHCSTGTCETLQSLVMV